MNEYGWACVYFPEGGCFCFACCQKHRVCESERGEKKKRERERETVVASQPLSFTLVVTPSLSSVEKGVDEAVYEKKGMAQMLC